MATKSLHMIGAASALLLAVACGEKHEDSVAPATPAAEPAPSAPAPSTAPAAPAANAPSTALPAIPEGAKVYFVEPQADAKIQGPLVDGKVSVPVKMGADNITVKPAGQIEAGSGHHHIIIDASSDPEGTVVAKDDQHLHFGQGQTEATLSLAPGEHTLHLQFADGIHRSYGPKLESTIKITVAEGAANAASAAAATGKTGSVSSAAKAQEEKNADHGKKKPEFQPAPPSAAAKDKKATAQGHEH